MRRIILLLAAASAAFAQLDTNVVTVSVSRQGVVQPDEVSLTAYVIGPPDQTLDQVVAALKGTNIKASDLTNFYTQGTAWTWVFGRVLPFSDMKSVLPILESLKTGAPISVDTYFLNATVPAGAAVLQQCPYPALINDARLQAGKLAAAAGGTLGAIVSIAPSTSIAPVPTSVSRIGAFSLLDPLTIVPSASSGFADFLLGYAFDDTSYIQTAPSPCALTIQFRLVHF